MAENLATDTLLLVSQKSSPLSSKTHQKQPEDTGPEEQPQDQCICLSSCISTLSMMNMHNRSGVARHESPRDTSTDVSH